MSFLQKNIFEYLVSVELSCYIHSIKTALDIDTNIIMDHFQGPFGAFGNGGIA